MLTRIWWSKNIFVRNELLKQFSLRLISAWFHKAKKNIYKDHFLRCETKKSHVDLHLFIEQLLLAELYSRTFFNIIIIICVNSLNFKA